MVEDASRPDQTPRVVLVFGEEWALPSWAHTPEYPRIAHCNSCQAPMLWVVTKLGNRAPLNQDGTSHFATCPDAARHRRKKGVTS